MTAARGLWAALRAAGGTVRVDRIAGAAGCSVSTARKYLREWAVAGLVEWPSRDARGHEGRHVARLTSDRGDPPMMSYDCGGKYVYLSLDSDRFLTIDYNHCPRPHAVNAVPVVTRRSRRADYRDCLGLDAPETGA